MIILTRCPSATDQACACLGRIFVSAALRDMVEPGTIDQVANVANLPGIVNYSMAMPDAHLGYGFPIGGVAAFREEDGIISPGGVGFDINCGVRLLRTDLQAGERAAAYQYPHRCSLRGHPLRPGSHGPAACQRPATDRGFHQRLQMGGGGGLRR